MHKIDHSTATGDGNFTEGNPQTGVKPTVVTADFLNAIQNELVNFILSRGIDLNKEDNTQLTQALSNLQSVTLKKIPILNNQADQLIGGEFVFDIEEDVGAQIYVYVKRKDSLQEKNCNGQIFINGNDGLEEFDFIPMLNGDDDHGVSFNIVKDGTKGRVRYSTSNYVGSNYKGEMFYSILKFKKQEL